MKNIYYNYDRLFSYNFLIAFVIGETEKYIIETPEGEKMGVYATISLLNQFRNVPEGAYVWITYKGKETTKKGREVKVYLVEYDDEV